MEEDGSTFSSLSDLSLPLTFAVLIATRSSRDEFLCAG